MKYLKNNGLTNFTFSSHDGLSLMGRAWISKNGNTKGIVYLVHGLGEHSGRYDHIGEALNNSGYQLMSFDLRGHGLSEGKRGHAPGFQYLLDDIEIFLNECNQRFDLKQPSFLYGHSLGGNLVIDLCFKRDLKLTGVIATSPVFATAFEPPKVTIAAAKIMAKLIPTFSLKNRIETSALSRDKAVVEAYRDDVFVHDYISARLGLDMLESGQYALENAHAWDSPLLLMHGTADRITSHKASQQFAEKAGDQVDLVLWEDYYHEIHNDIHNDKVINTLIDWLNKNTEGEKLNIS